MKIKKTMRVFYAKFIISMKIYFRYPINFFMNLLNPIIWIAPFYFMAKAFSSNGKLTGFSYYTGNSDYIGFLVLGYMISSYVNMVFWGMGFSLREEMRQGVLESNWSTPVNKITFLISEGLFQFCSTTIEVILTGILSHFIFNFNITPHLLEALLFLLPGIIGLMGLGLAIGALVLVVKEANTIIDIGSAFLSGISGGYFPVKIFPKGIMFIALAVPLTYVYDSSRAILSKQIPIFDLKTEFIIIIISMIFFCILGSLIFKMVEKKCRELGLLGTH